jgi:SAM-dependent methyltransferase
MGIDKTGLEAILYSLKYVTNKKTLLTLGHQGIHIDQSTVDQILDEYNLLESNKCEQYADSLFLDLGFETVDSLDYSSFEGASLIHNLNTPLPADHKTFDYIFDGGTIEHIFNLPQVCENIINLLNIGGLYISVVPNNNFSGHGIYQFSPEFFLSAFTPTYGTEVVALYLAEVDSRFDRWIDVLARSLENEGRNLSKFNTTNAVYIIAVVKKISNDRENLITKSPNQYSYENVSWK